MRVPYLLLVLALFSPISFAAYSKTYVFSNLGEKNKDDVVQVRAGDRYTKERGYGFESGAVFEGVRHSVLGHGEFLVASGPFYFTFSVPEEGNYLVSLLGGSYSPGDLFGIKAELRRSIVQHRMGPSFQSFIVNVRNPRISASATMKEGAVKLKAPRETTKEAWAWDDAITLELNGEQPVLSSIKVERVENRPTIYLLGDSTVCDQSAEPYASWGQMLPLVLFCDPPQLTIANHAESGETAHDSIGRRRLDKIDSLLRPGDWLFVQFGHNDQKQVVKTGGGPFTTYKEELRKHVAVAKSHGANAVIVTPMERRAFDAQGKVVPSLADFAEAGRQLAAEEKVPCIDLNRMSITLYEALEAREKGSSQAAFVPGDTTHHNNFGAYELARCIVADIAKQKLGLCGFNCFRYGDTNFDPAKPDDPAKLQLPASPRFTNERPLGDTPNGN